MTTTTATPPPPPAYRASYDPPILDSPTSARSSIPVSPARSSLPLSAFPAPEAHGHRQTRFVEEGLIAPMTPTSSAVPGSSASRPTSSAPIAINPASIPTRISSSRAFTNPEPPASPPYSREQKILMTFPDDSKRRTEGMENGDWPASHRPQGSNGNGNGNPIMDHPSAPIGQDLIHGSGSRWSPEKENIVKGPFDYLESHPGKDVRTQLIDAFNLWLQVPPADLAIINKVVGMLHTASLLIDDVEDNSQLRRGVPVAHAIFGTAQTINSANYIYFCALQELSRLPDPPAAIRIYTEELLNLHRGQGMDLFWRDTLTCPSEDDYLEMVGNKTGGLFRLAIKLMFACSPTNPSHPTLPTQPHHHHHQQPPIDYIPLVNTIGLLFQILDDYRNLSSPLYTAHKGLAEDLTEGKFSFPIIHAIRADPANLVLINILKQKTLDDDVKRYAVAYMERVGSFAYTRRVLRGLTKKALGLVGEVDAGRGRGGGVQAILELLRVEKGGGKDAKLGESL